MDHGVTVPRPAEAEPAAGPPVPDAARTEGRRRGWHWLAGTRWPLVAVLVVQSALSLRLAWSNTAFEDEALYLWAGRLEWAHWLHGAPTPDFPSYFSGAPVIYPPLAALADTVGGLAGARILSLCFMLGATVLLWATASRLFGRRAAVFAAALWAMLGPTQRLGAFATYDAMALFLVALAAWCVTGSRGKRATRWMLAGAGLLVLANATKYASVIFDPAVAGLAFLCGFPPGAKVAWRRGGCVAALLVVADVTLLLAARGHYLLGVDQTTLVRPSAGTRVSVILRNAWDWTGVVVVLAFLGVAIGLRAERHPRSRWLLGLLAVTGLLVPAAEARIHTFAGLDKHADFGAWFAAIAAGYAIDGMARVLHREAPISSAPMPPAATPPAAMAPAAMPPAAMAPAAMAPAAMAPAAMAPAAIATAALFLLVTLVGAVQSAQLFDWPGAANVLPAARELTSHGGRFLADNDPLFEYYLPDTSWRQWSSVYSVTLPSGYRQATSGAPAPYVALITEHYFQVVILGFTDRPPLDAAIARSLAADHDYRFVGTFLFSHRGVPGGFRIWVYRGRAGDGAGAGRRPGR